MNNTHVNKLRKYELKLQAANDLDKKNLYTQKIHMYKAMSQNGGATIEELKQKINELLEDDKKTVEAVSKIALENRDKANKLNNMVKSERTKNQELTERINQVQQQANVSVDVNNKLMEAEQKLQNTNSQVDEIMNTLQVPRVPIVDNDALLSTVGLSDIDETLKSYTDNNQPQPVQNSQPVQSNQQQGGSKTIIRMKNLL